MKRYGQIGLAVFLLCVGGCASRGNVELLESQLRHQEDQLYAMRTQLNQADAELNLAHKEVEALRVQLADSGKSKLLPEQVDSLFRVAGVHVQKLFTGGLNQDGKPGDELLNIVIVPQDEHGETVKLPGDVEFEVIDPAAPETSQRLGMWKFSSEEVAKHWQSGLTSGFQFRMPWQVPPASEDLVLHARYKTADGRPFGTSCNIRITPDPAAFAQMQKRTPPADVAARDFGLQNAPPPEPTFPLNQAGSSDNTLTPSANHFVESPMEANQTPPLRTSREQSPAAAEEFFTAPDKEGSEEANAALLDEGEFHPLPMPGEVQHQANQAKENPAFVKSEPQPLPKPQSVQVGKPATDSAWKSLEGDQAEQETAPSKPGEFDRWSYGLKTDKTESQLPSKPAELPDGFRPISAANTNSEIQPVDVDADAAWEQPPMRYQRANREIPAQALPTNSRDQKPDWK